MRSTSLILLTFFSFACTDRKKPSDSTLNSTIDTIIKIDSTFNKKSLTPVQDTHVIHPNGYKDISLFYDNTINNIKLNDCDTIEKLFGENYALLPDIDDLPSIQILNNTESQLLTMYMWNGSPKCHFSQFQVE